MFAMYYSDIKTLHVACVILSGSLFAARCGLRLAGNLNASHRALRIISYAIDSVLLTAGILLMLDLHQYPLINAWLTVKLMLVAIYIALGILCLRTGRSRRVRLRAMIAAFMTYLLIVGVAVTRHPAGWLHLL